MPDERGLTWQSRSHPAVEKTRTWRAIQNIQKRQSLEDYMAAPIGIKMCLAFAGAAPGVKREDGALKYKGSEIKDNTGVSVHVKRTLVALAVIAGLAALIGGLSYANLLQISSPIGTIGMGHSMGAAFWMMSAAGGATLLMIILRSISAGIHHKYNPEPKEAPKV